MAKICEVVKVNTGYASAVNLEEEFLNPDSNRGRMERYQPVKSHREAFLRLTRSLELGPSKDRCFLLTGNFGTGKSHLLLMLANYLHNTSDQPEIKSFLSNWRQVDPDSVDRLTALRKNKRWLVAVCGYGTNDDFEEVVLRSIMDACGPDRENFEGILDTQYQEALRKLDTWEQEELAGTDKLRFYSNFVETLQEMEPDYTIARLREELKAHHGPALAAFKGAFKKLLPTEDFRFGKKNMVAIIKEFTSSQEFKDRYAGLAILFDEFGYVLENRRISLNIWQSFAELCNGGDMSSQPCVFIAAAHKSFSNYAKGWDDFAKESGRIKEIPLTAEGIEDIIGAMVQPLTGSPAWISEITPRENVLNGFAAECRRLQIFDWLDAPAITEKISKGAYPMHPMGTYCLLELAREIGSNNRTAFTFFSSEDDSEPGSFSWFIHHNDILDGQNLRLYTADLLAQFFAREITTSNRELRDELRKMIANYEASFRELQKLRGAGLPDEALSGPETTSLLHVILVLQLAKVAATFDNIAFALSKTATRDLRHLENLLGVLKERKVLYLAPVTRTYDFLAAERPDIEEWLESYVSAEEHRPADLASEMMGVTVDRGWPGGESLPTVRTAAALHQRDRVLSANRHNNPWNEDKQAIRVFARPSNLQAPGWYDRLQSEWLEDGDYDAVCVYVVCETAEEIAKAREAAQANPDDRILIAMPREPLPVTEAIMNLRAAQAIAASSDFDNYSTAVKATVNELIGDAHSGYQGKFFEIRNAYLDGQKLSWNGKAGRQLAANPKSAHEALDTVMDELYEKHNRVQHDEFNKSHVYSFASPLGMRNKAQIKDAVNDLLTTHRDIEINTTYGEDKGEIKYLRKLLLNHSVLRQTGKPAGGVIACQVEHDESKYASSFPALVDMEADVSRLGEQDQLRLGDLVRKYAGPPYGLGPTAILMFFACLLRLFRDEVVIKREQGAAGQVSVTEFDHLWDLLSGKSPGAFLLRRPISEGQRELLNEYYSIFTGEPKGVSDARTVYEVVDAIGGWWDAQPRLAQMRSLYTGEGSDSVRRLVDALCDRQSVEASDFVFDRLAGVCGESAAMAVQDGDTAAVTRGITAAKRAVEAAPADFKSRLFNQVRGVFGVKDVTYDDCREALSDWVNALDTNQRNEHEQWHSAESRAVVRLLPKITDIEETLFVLLPEAFGLGRVADWTTDKSPDYIAKLSEGKALIERNAIRVASPVITTLMPGQELKGKDGKWQVQYTDSSRVRIEGPGDGVVVRMTDSGEDPASDASQVVTIKSSHEYVVTGGTKTVRLISRDAEGNFGVPCEIQFVDQNGKYIIAPPQTLVGIDRIVPIVLPPDPAAFVVSIRSLVDTSIKEKAIDRPQAAASLREIANDLEKKAG